MQKVKFKMKIDLNVLNHLGINLYSNTPAVISEAIANSWDAGAENVSILIDTEKNEMIIEDDGSGMTLDELNGKFLRVGYKKRENGENSSPKHSRKVMGRKGIGKLSLFSIANVIEVQSSKDGETNGFTMKSLDIETSIANEQEYHPTELPIEAITIKNNGTKITLREIKKKVNKTEDFLIKRIARRFSVLGSAHHFIVKVNNHTVTINDRQYFDKLQAIWYFSGQSKEYVDYCDKDKLLHSEELAGNIANSSISITGWIGTVQDSGTLKEKDDNESNNKISIIVRGKVALEDILPELAQSGLYANYLVGEIHADFLDDDNDEDIATSSRQDFKKNDERYIMIRDAIKGHLKTVQQKWEELRVKRGVHEATQIPAIKTWFEELQGDTKRKAEKLFGKINQVMSDNPEQKKVLFQQSVMAFEYFKHKDALDKLTELSNSNIESILSIFNNLDDLEASLYYKIVTQRLEVISVLEKKVQENELEKTIQELLFNHLWLLDPSWERAAGSEFLEKSFQGYLEEAKLTQEEKDGRMDIKYRQSSGTHIIIELKRPEVEVSVYSLIQQVNKYKEALSKILTVSDDSSAIQTICIVGRKPKELKSSAIASTKNAALSSLASNSIKIVLYNDLLQNAKKAYQEYLGEHEKIGKTQRLLDAISSSSFE